MAGSNAEPVRNSGMRIVAVVQEVAAAAKFVMMHAPRSCPPGCPRECARYRLLSKHYCNDYVMFPVNVYV
jgi:hypothetical protein